MKIEKVQNIKDNTNLNVKKRKKDLNTIPTGADLLDLVAGKGFVGGFINIVGDSSSGKSFLAGEIIGHVYHANKELEWYYDNAEVGYRIDSKSLYGIDILNEGFFSASQKSSTIQEFEYKIDRIIEGKKPNVPFIYILDSLDSLSVDEELSFVEKRSRKLKKKIEDEDSDDGKKESGTYNLQKQKYLHQFCRTHIRKLEENNIYIFIISQVKEKIGITFGTKYYRTGGKAIDFYPNTILWIAEAEKYKRKKRDIGICIKVKATKSRAPRPFRTCYLDLLFDYGIDNISSNLKFLYDLKTDGGKDKEKSILEWDGKKYSLSDLVKHIEKNNLEDELTKRVKEEWERIEESISSKDRKRKW